MLEEIIDNNGNVISTKKKNLISLQTNQDNKELNKKPTKLSFKKKLAYSLFTSFMFLYTSYMINKYYREHDDHLAPDKAHTTKCSYEIAYCLIKNFDDDGLKVNSLGFKGEEFQIEKAENIYRIVVLGGSTSFGDYPKYLEDILNSNVEPSKSNIRYEVINGAVRGYGSDEILKRFMHDVIPLKPDLVIYGPEWNDAFGCALLSTEERKTLNLFFSGLVDNESLRKLGPWYEKHIADFERNRDNRLENAKRVAIQVGDILGQKTYLLKRARDKLRTKLLSASNMDSLSHMDDYPPTHTLNNMSEIIKTCEVNNIKISLVTTHDDFEDFGNSVPWLPSCGIFFDMNDWCRYNRKSLNPSVRKLALEHNLILIDLERSFNAESSKRKYFASDDGKTGEFMHFNDLGNKKVAEIMFKTLWPYLKDPS